MNKQVFLFAGVLSALVLTGCATTTVYDPATTTTNMRSLNTVGSEEMRQVAVDGARAAMTNHIFLSFLQKYKVEMKDPNAIPLLKLDQCINDTADHSLNTDEITDLINETLLNSGKVNVTMAEGAGRSQSLAESRNIEYDDNFDLNTVAKRGTLQAARLVLRPKVMENIVQDGGKKAVVRTFVLDMGDIHTGLTIWKYTKQLGFMKNSGIVGW